MAWANTLSPADTNGRTAQRRPVKLTARVHDGGSSHEAEIVNLSPTGALLLLPVKIDRPSSLIVDFPEIGRVTATVVWHNDSLFGCEFTSPLPRATVSAALLKSQPVFTQNPPLSSQDRTAHVPVPETRPLPLRTRLLAIIALACLAWAPIAGTLIWWLW